MPPEKPPLEVVSGDVIVAGYFQQGAMVPVTFAQYMQIIWDSEDGLPPAYLQPENGFVGIILMRSLRGDGPDNALPKFANPMLARGA